MSNREQTIWKYSQTFSNIQKSFQDEDIDNKTVTDYNELAKEFNII